MIHEFIDQLLFDLRVERAKVAALRVYVNELIAERRKLIEQIAAGLTPNPPVVIQVTASRLAMMLEEDRQRGKGAS